MESPPFLHQLIDVDSPGPVGCLESRRCGAGLTFLKRVRKYPSYGIGLAGTRRERFQGKNPAQQKGQPATTLAQSAVARGRRDRPPGAIDDLPAGVRQD